MKNAAIILMLSSFAVFSGCKKSKNLTIPDNTTTVNSCSKPTNIGLYTTGAGATLHWDDVNYPESAYYQFEYGISGFTLGNGQQVNASGTSSEKVSMAAGNVYQFYVRGYCDATGGFSDWSGPFSYYNENNHNMCLAPTNVSYSVADNAFSEPVGAEMTWSHNGESKFECVMVSNNASPESGVIQTVSSSTVLFFLTQNTEYDFYVRGVCISGDKTNWVGPKNVNIGG